MVDAKSSRLDLQTCMKMYDKDRVEFMRKIAQEKLGKYYDALKRFYARVLFESQYQYIVFVARRSIDLAELFTIILWDEDESWDRLALEENWLKFTTDSSILTLTDEIAEELLHRHYPQILVVDDILVQGNGLNELMRGIEYHVGESIKRKINDDDEFIQFRNGFDTDEAFINSLKDELIQALEIRVFAQNAQMSVLALRYHLRLVLDSIMWPDEWHKLSCKITNAISATGITNAVFITGADIPFYTAGCGDPTGNVKPFDFESICRCIEGEYAIRLESSDDKEANGKRRACKDIESYYLIYEKEAKNKIKYVCSLRFIINRYTATCKVLPFVFLPQLTENSLSILKEAITDKWGFSFNSNKVSDSNVGASRMEYELLLLYLSESLLSCWTKPLVKGKFISELAYDELKPAINYTVNRGDLVVSANAFRRLQNREYLFHWDELENILNKITLDTDPICSNYSSMTSSTDSIRQLQDIVYEIKNQELIESYRCFNNLPELESAPIGLSLKENRKHNWNITLKTFVQNCISKIRNLSCKNIFCELLSYMDKGIVTLKVRKQDGVFSQVLRMGEQSFILWPERYDEYIPVMIQIQERAERLGGSVREYLLEFLTHAQQIEIIDPAENLAKLTDDLMLFLESLRKSGQRLEDWNIGFDNPVVLEKEDKWLDRVGKCYVIDRYEAFDKSEKKTKLFNACLDYWP